MHIYMHIALIVKVHPIAEQKVGMLSSIVISKKKDKNLVQIKKAEGLHIQKLAKKVRIQGPQN